MKLSKGIWYWKTREDAEFWAESSGYPMDRILEYSKGFAIQLYRNGPYVGPATTLQDIEEKSTSSVPIDWLKPE
jgi:hypothetical protein